MRKLIVSEFVSLDGVIQAPVAGTMDPDCGFGRGKGIWTDDAPQVVLPASPTRLSATTSSGRFTLKSATPYPTGVVGLDYERRR